MLSSLTQMLVLVSLLGLGCCLPISSEVSKRALLDDRNIIGSRCECFVGRMVFYQRTCIDVFGSDGYENQLGNQIDLERRRNVKRVAQGLPERPEPFEHLEQCRRQIAGHEAILKTFGHNVV